MKKLIFILMVGSLFAQDDNNVDEDNEDIISESAESIISSGDKLVKFRKMFYKGVCIQTLGQLLIIRSLQDDIQGRVRLGGKLKKFTKAEAMQSVGVLFALGGGIYSFISFNQIGEAGEDLIQVGKKLETED